MKDRSNWENLIVIVYWGDDNDTNMLSYEVKIKSVKKVLLLATMQYLLDVTKDYGIKKAGQYKFYDFRNRRRNDCNKRSESNCWKPKLKKLTIVALYYVLDVARISAGTNFVFSCYQSLEKIICLYSILGKDWPKVWPYHLQGKA